MATLSLRTTDQLRASSWKATSILLSSQLEQQDCKSWLDSKLLLEGRSILNLLRKLFAIQWIYTADKSYLNWFQVYHKQGSISSTSIVISNLPHIRPPFMNCLCSNCGKGQNLSLRTISAISACPLLLNRSTTTFIKLTMAARWPSSNWKKPGVVCWLVSKHSTKVGMLSNGSGVYTIEMSLSIFPLAATNSSLYSTIDKVQDGETSILPTLAEPLNCSRAISQSFKGPTYGTFLTLEVRVIGYLIQGPARAYFQVYLLTILEHYDDQWKLFMSGTFRVVSSNKPTEDP